jgi:hypothetical protein
MSFRGLWCKYPRPIGYSGLSGIRGGRHSDREVIILCVRWYLRYKLSFRDLVEMMAERGLNLAHTTILRWVRRYAQSSSSVGTALVGPLAARGESMRPISRYSATGTTYIGGGQGWTDDRLQDKPDTQCSCSEGLLQEGDQT